VSEEWYDTPAPYEGYQASSEGRIRHKKTQQIKKITYDHRGTPRVTIYGNGKTASCRAHHVIWHTFYGWIPYGCCVIPRDGDWTNIRPENLECVTVKERRKRQWAEYNRLMDDIFEETRKEFENE
jgi:hypothetical protein